MTVAADVAFVGRLGYRRDGEYRSRSNRQHVSQALPGSVFDARYKGLTADAVRLDAAVCRRERLR